MRFQGIIPAVLMPSDVDGRPDARSLTESVRWMVDAGVDTIVALSLAQV
jgi:dihydrodipicolinate synthase/N-acetylneuraminate lyase